MTPADLARIAAAIAADERQTDVSNWPLPRERTRAYLALARVAAHIWDIADDWWIDYDYEQGDTCRSCEAHYDARGKLCGYVDLAHAPGCRRDELAFALAALAPEEVPDADAGAVAGAVAGT